MAGIVVAAVWTCCFRKIPKERYGGTRSLDAAMDTTSLGRRAAACPSDTNQARHAAYEEPARAHTKLLFWTSLACMVSRTNSVTSTGILGGQERSWAWGSGRDWHGAEIACVKSKISLAVSDRLSIPNLNDMVSAHSRSRSIRGCTCFCDDAALSWVSGCCPLRDGL